MNIQLFQNKFNLKVSDRTEMIMLNSFKSFPGKLLDLVLWGVDIYPNLFSDNWSHIL